MVNLGLVVTGLALFFGLAWYFRREVKKADDHDELVDSIEKSRATDETWKEMDADYKREPLDADDRLRDLAKKYGAPKRD